jgi:predicted dehydrogenase
MAKSAPSGIFKTNKRIRLGIWGLGRGLSFYRACAALNIDVVAGCDYNEHMRANFLKLNPGAFVTDNAAEFLARDFDAVLLATFCPAHADDAIQCLNSGKHVISEVTSFHTMAEGVRLTEAVERSGKVYNLAENYPFSASNMYLGRLWREGVFGELQYGEYEYVHEVLTLAYTYIDSHPIIPGNWLHNWRSWISIHYYNTHSLGPMMVITGERPTRVVSLPATPKLPGYIMPDGAIGMGGAAPSLISMSNGGVVRNLMGATTNDSHNQRLWGTRGSAEQQDGQLRLRLGGGGGSPKFAVKPKWDELGDHAIKMGHGGGDFWVLYYFVRQILEGTPAPFDIYNAADCTIPGLLAYRSQRENGKPYDVPDFRDPKQRAAWKDDTYAQPRYPVKGGQFPADQDTTLTQHFSKTIRDLVWTSRNWRAFQDWRARLAEMANPAEILPLWEKTKSDLPTLRESATMARKMVDRYPESDGAGVLRALLGTIDEATIHSPGYEKELAGLGTSLNRVMVSTGQGPLVNPWLSPFVASWEVSRKRRKTKDGVAAAPVVSLDERLGWTMQATNGKGAEAGFLNLHSLFGDQDGLVYCGKRFYCSKPGQWDLLLGHDGGIQVFVDGKSVLTAPETVNPAPTERSRVTLKLKKGEHEIIVAFDLNKGKGWGLYARFEVPKAARKGLKQASFPLPLG